VVAEQTLKINNWIGKARLQPTKTVCLLVSLQTGLEKLQNHEC